MLYLERRRASFISLNVQTFPRFLCHSGSSLRSLFYNPHYAAADVAVGVLEKKKKKPAKRSTKEEEEAVSSRSRRLTTRQRLWAASTWIQSSTKTPWQAGCAVRTGRGWGGGFDSRYEPLNHRTSSLRTATMQSGRLTVNVFRYGEYVSGGPHVIIYTPLLHAEMELFFKRMRCIQAPFHFCRLFLALCCVTIRRGMNASLL